VRRSLLICGFAALCAIGVAKTFAAPTLAPSVETQSTAVHIAPHRAIYKMSLGGIKNGANISDVSGRMLFEWQDVCDGWAIQQHMQLHFTYANGDSDQDILSTELTWESKDGKQYNFNIRRVTNGKETENYKGKGLLNDDGSGTVTYSNPANKIEKLPVGTLFPSAHTTLIIQKAKLGEKLFTRRVFDGSDEDGSSDISAFISPQQAVSQDASLDSKLKADPLLADAAWPVHMAFFDIGSETGEPDYEMDLNLLPNGVARHMKIDYGDFSVVGSLQEIEPLPAQNCQ
jgi:hypothetical protein